MADSGNPSPVMSVERNSTSAEFFDGTARGELLIKTCQRCGHHRAARRGRCRACGAGEFDWTPATGDGYLVAWGFHPAESDLTAFGLVELAEGPWLESLLIDVTQADLRAGLPLTVTFVRGADGEAYPAFRPC